MKNILKNILLGLHYLSNKGIADRDLKPENILIENEEKDSGYLNIKIIDFGTAKLFDKNKTEKSVIGSAYYIAPEVLNEKYNEKCDIWSLGVVLFEMLFGVGVAVMIMSHVIVNIGMNIGLMPVTGINLPFMSYGGSHLLTSFIALGILSSMNKDKRVLHRDDLNHEFLGI